MRGRQLCRGLGLGSPSRQPVRWARGSISAYSSRRQALAAALRDPFHLALKFYRSLIQAPPASYPQVIPKHNMFGVTGTEGGVVLSALAQLVLLPVKEPGDRPYRFG